MQVKCEHCDSGIASLFCHSDGCFLCSSCDAEVHSNKITQRHVRVSTNAAPPWALNEARSKGILLKDSAQEAWGDSGPICDPFPSRPHPAADYGSAPNCDLLLAASVSGDDPSNGNSTGSCHPGDARGGCSNEADPNAPDGSGIIQNHQLKNTISSRLSSPGQVSKGQVNNLENALNGHHAHLPLLDHMDVSDLIPPGALDLANMDNSIHGNQSEGGQLANLFELFGIPSTTDGSQHGSVHQGTNWQQQQQQQQLLQESEERMMLDVLLSGNNDTQGGDAPQRPSTRPPTQPSSGLLSAAFNPRPSDAFAAPYSASPFHNPQDPKPLPNQNGHQQFRPGPLATCQSVHEGGLFAAAAACHDGAAYSAIMNGSQARGPMMSNPAVSASYSLGRQPLSSSLAAAAAAAEAGGSGSYRKATFGSLNRDHSGTNNLGGENHSETAVRGGSLYLSTVASGGGGQKRVLDLNSVPPPSIGSQRGTQIRNPGSFRSSLNGSLGCDVPSWQEPPGLDNTPRSKALHSTLNTSPSMQNLYGAPPMTMPGYPPQREQQHHRGLSMDGSRFGSMEQNNFLGRSHNQGPGLSGSYDEPDLAYSNFSNSLTRQPMLMRSSSMLPLQEHPLDLSRQLLPDRAKAVDPPDRAAVLNRYRLKKMNRLKAYAQDSLPQEKKGRQSLRQGSRGRVGSGRLGSRDDESGMTNGTSWISPDGSSENKERDAGDEDTSRIRHEMNMIHLGYNHEGLQPLSGLHGQITDQELHELGMSLAPGPNLSPAAFNWPESNCIPEELPMGSSADQLLMPDLDDRTGLGLLPPDTTDLLDAILSDSFNPADLLL